MTIPPRRVDVGRLRAKVEARSRDRTHSDECYLWDDHRDCAILALLDELEAARAVVEAAREVALNCEPGRPLPDVLAVCRYLNRRLAAYDRSIVAAADDGRDGG